MVEVLSHAVLFSGVWLERSLWTSAFFVHTARLLLPLLLQVLFRSTGLVSLWWTANDSDMPLPITNARSCFCLTPFSSFPSSLFKSIFEWEVNPRSLPHISREQEELWPVVLVWVLKDGIRRCGGTDTKSMALSKPLAPLEVKTEFLSGDYICSWASDPLAPFFPSLSFPSSSELQITYYSEARVLDVLNSLTFRPQFFPFHLDSRDGLWLWHTHGTNVSGALHTGCIVALKRLDGARRKWSEGVFMGAWNPIQHSSHLQIALIGQWFKMDIDSLCNMSTV